MTFAGFSNSALEFLEQIRANNNRDWFAPRKAFYEDEVKAPMLQLVTEVASQCQKKGFPLFPKDRAPVSRIYRDIRFSLDKRPFQHHVGATLHGRASAVCSGEVYLHVSPEGSFLAAGFYMPDKGFVRVTRNRMCEQPEEFATLVKTLRKKSLEFSKDGQLKRMPRGFERFADSQVSPYLKLTSLVVSQKLEPEQVTTPKLVSLAVSFALASRPLLEWGWGLGYKPAPRRDPDFM